MRAVRCVRVLRADSVSCPCGARTRFQAISASTQPRAARNQCGATSNGRSARVTTLPTCPTRGCCASTRAPPPRCFAHCGAPRTYRRRPPATPPTVAQRCIGSGTHSGCIRAVVACRHGKRPVTTRTACSPTRSSSTQRAGNIGVPSMYSGCSPDFRLLPGSPAFKLGIHSLDSAQTAGPRSVFC